jgi:hypothetical protein
MVWSSGMDVEQWNLQAWTPGCVEGVLYLPGGDAMLSLRLDVMRGDPSSAQIAAVHEFLAHWVELREPLAKALFAWYRATVRDVDDDLPELGSPDQAWSFVDLGELHVPVTTASASRLVRLTGSCDWEPEHGLEIGVRGGRELLYVGPNEGKGLREPRYASPLNFADPAIQEAALQGQPISEEAFEGAQTATAPVSPAKKPWWRLG